MDNSTGYIYVADKDNNRICRFFNMEESSWAVYGSLGAGVGQFDFPWGIFIDSSSGYIYIADTNNHRLVRINDMTGTGWVEQAGIAQIMDVVFLNYIYVVIPGVEGYIRRYAAMGGVPINYGGTLNDPRGVDVDIQERIYIAESGNDRIVRIDDMTGANFTTYGSTGAGRGEFNCPVKVRIDSEGKIYVLDKDNNRLIRIDDMNGTGWTVYDNAAFGGFHQPEGLDVNL